MTGVAFKVNGKAVPAGGVSRNGSTYSFTYRPTARIALDTVAWEVRDAAGHVARGSIRIAGVH